MRALVAALEKTEGQIEVITDNQYVRNTAQYLASGGTVHKGKHYDLWAIIKQHIQQNEEYKMGKSPFK